MDRLKVRVHINYTTAVFLIFICAGQFTNALNEEYILDTGSSSPFRAQIARLDHPRYRRDTSSPAESKPAAHVDPASAPVPPALVNNATVPPSPVYQTGNASSGYDPSALPTVSVTQIPLLGVNGSGILHVDLPGNQPKVSEPITPDDNFTDIFNQPERILSEHNLANLTYDYHSFYNSTFIGNKDYFNEYWANISTVNAQIHPILSNSHRRATSIRLSFDFPFYGHNIRNITVATGGFIYTGEHVHNWLAATQYIAPLMANFDTTLTNDSVIKLIDEGDNFTAFWENVTLQEDKTKKFTFAVTLYKTGDIVFAYKNIPIEVQDINDTDHPVKVGISDAYLTDKIMFYVRRKTIYEYHRVSFKDHMITNSTILKIIPLPTCLQYNTCETCVNHNTGFNCSWCPSIGKCSSGTDRNKQDWLLRRCEKTAISQNASCSATTEDGVANTTYVTDQTAHTNKTANTNQTTPSAGEDARGVSPLNSTPTHEERSPIGGVVGAFLVITLICSVAAWALYAFKNPHTRSGQLLIKYRPTQWNWRRGEARYTAATIHM